MRALALPIMLTLLLCSGARVDAQGTTDFGLPPASGSQNPVLPPPSGSQNPVLPPPSGQRYIPGVGGPFGGSDLPGSGERRLPRPPRSGGGDVGLIGTVDPATEASDGKLLDTLADIAPALRRCWTPPPIDGGDTGVMATVRFSLRRDGSLFGQPRVTWETTSTGPDLRRRFADSVSAAVRSCTPMRLSQPLGAAIAGRPLSIRFHGPAPTPERRPAPHQERPT